MKYIKGLDTVRAMAIILVIIGHWGPHKFKSTALTFFFSKILPTGTFGVDLFFVLSGYLITRILLTARAEAKEDERFKIIKNFYIRRALRIFPIYFLYVLVLAYVLDDSYTRENLFWFLTYLSNLLAVWNGKAYIPHTWSLAVEEQFYIIWPWIMLFSPKKYLFAIILAAIGFGVINTLVLPHFYGVYGYFLLMPCITAFGIGALYAYIEIEPRFYKPVVTTFKILLPVSIILLFVHQLYTELLLIRAIDSVIAVSLIIYVCKQNYNVVTKRIFNNKMLINIGKISYGIYLYHLKMPDYYYQFIHYLQQKVQIDPTVLKLITVPPTAYLIHLVLIFIIAMLSYRFIETGFLRLKKYFEYTASKDIITEPVGLVK